MALINCFSVVFLVFINSLFLEMLLAPGALPGGGNNFENPLNMGIRERLRSPRLRREGPGE